jgi:hypothetical protein
VNLTQEVAHSSWSNPTGTRMTVFPLNLGRGMYYVAAFKSRLVPNLSIDEIADLINLINDEKWNCNNNCDT